MSCEGTNALLMQRAEGIHSVHRRRSFSGRCLYSAKCGYSLSKVKLSTHQSRKVLSVQTGKSLSKTGKSPHCKWMRERYGDLSLTERGARSMRASALIDLAEEPLRSKGYLALALCPCALVHLSLYVLAFVP